ncbi:VanZ family protein (plasmid) [Hymenobacter sp. BRD128]|uniref:VanZ family protein n=1 Tax=Hymenobacter sp. BRD128 TaxID=2675878 RepID=UPI00156353A5|nr:VanZ family protein [Hymenobacter sp. BRD128]QKG59244.1 VanZ family protein [Hymenobacter sp. BRD128]
MKPNPATLHSRATQRLFRWGLVLGLLAFTAFEELSLRPSLRRHHVTRFGQALADSLPNFLAPLLLGALYVTLFQKQTRQEVTRACLSVVAGLVLYEFAQLWMADRVFDVQDIVATLLGGLVAWLILRVGCT